MSAAPGAARRCLVVTDSGHGGLSVVAALDRRLRRRGGADRLKIVYVNAAPSDTLGYQDLPTRADKLRTFAAVLRSSVRRDQPGAVVVACNTLSSLLGAPQIADVLPVPSLAIIAPGVAALLALARRRPATPLVVLATQTTVQEGAHARLAAEQGLAPARLHLHACPGLATAISNDLDGRAAPACIDAHVDALLADLAPHPARLGVLLACTHYGYRRAAFVRSFARRGVLARVLDPNDALAAAALRWLEASDWLGSGGDGPGIEVLSRYPLPPREVQTVARLLASRSPATAAALREHRCDPALFDLA